MYTCQFSSGIDDKFSLENAQMIFSLVDKIDYSIYFHFTKCKPMHFLQVLMTILV